MFSTVDGTWQPGNAVRNRPTIDQVIEALKWQLETAIVATRAGSLGVRFHGGITLLALHIAPIVIEPLEIINAGLQARENTVTRIMKAVAVVKTSLVRMLTEDSAI